MSPTLGNWYPVNDTEKDSMEPRPTFDIADHGRQTRKSESNCSGIEGPPREPGRGLNVVLCGGIVP